MSLPRSPQEQSRLWHTQRFLFRAKEAEEIEASLGRIIKTLANAPSLAGKAKIWDRLHAVKTNAHNLAQNLHLDQKTQP